jgi:flavorubredoxin
MTRVDEVGDGIYRLSTVLARGYGSLSFNQFLIDDERPALIHTGHHPLYSDVRRAIAQVLDPARLQYVVIGHFEADECGGMGRFVAEAPRSTLVCSDVGAAVNLGGWDYAGAVQGVRDGDAIDLGRHRLRFLETPHVHHWDSLMVVEELTASLFPADLYIQPGDQPAIVREDLSRDMCELYRELGIFAAEAPVRRVVERLDTLGLRWIHPMHGGSLPADVAARYSAALRREPFAFEGKLRGRLLPGWPVG